MPAGVSAYTALANVTLGSNAATVTFSSINQGYRDLVLVISISSASDGFDYIRLNGDTGSNYNMLNMEGVANITQSISYANNTYLNPSMGSGGNNATTTINFMDYSATDKQKSILWRFNKPSLVLNATAARWASTSAITSISFFQSGTNVYAAGSTFALYGVSA
jgi:hypothetical protein